VEEIQASKREVEEITKIEMVRISEIQSLLGSPD
jgi:hypothetical protein